MLKLIWDQLERRRDPTRAGDEVEKFEVVDVQTKVRLHWRSQC